METTGFDPGLLFFCGEAGASPVPSAYPAGCSTLFCRINPDAAPPLKIYPFFFDYQRPFLNLGIDCADILAYYPDKEQLNGGEKKDPDY